MMSKYFEVDGKISPEFKGQYYLGKETPSKNKKIIY